MNNLSPRKPFLTFVFKNGKIRIYDNPYPDSPDPIEVLRSVIAQYVKLMYEKEGRPISPLTRASGMLVLYKGVKTETFFMGCREDTRELFRTGGGDAGIRPQNLITQKKDTAIRVRFSICKHCNNECTANNKIICDSGELIQAIKLAIANNFRIVEDASADMGEKQAMAGAIANSFKGPCGR